MISSPGVGSGLDINSIIDGLMAVERTPLNRLESQKSDVQVEISANGQLKSAISQLQVAAQAIKDRTTLTAVSASSSDATVLSASTNSTAIKESHTLVVTQLAQQHKLTSTAYADADTAIGTGTLDIIVAGNTLSLNLATGNNTLTQIRDAINQSANNPGVSASIITVNAGSKLVLTAKNSGVANAVTLTVDPALTGFAMTELNPAKDASLTVDGFAVTRSSNTITDVIQGVTLTLAGAGTANLDLKPDSTALGKALDGFVNGFNSLRGNIKALRNGALSGDATLLGLEKSLRDRISNPITIGAATPAYLSELGISFLATGDLSLDKIKLDSAVNAGVGHVLDLLADPTVGIGTRIDTFLESYMKTDGLLDVRNQTLTDRTTRIDRQIEGAQFRLDNTERRLRAQFTSLDNLLTRLQTTGSFLTQQLSNLANFNNGKN